jgi:hypothetical protein
MDTDRRRTRRQDAILLLTLVLGVLGPAPWHLMWLFPLGAALGLRGATRWLRLAVGSVSAAAVVLAGAVLVAG